jgi:hypothetical protein
MIRPRQNTVKTTVATQVSYPLWREKKLENNPTASVRLELVEKSGVCGYIECLQAGVSPRFFVYLNLKNGNSGLGSVLVGGYADLDSAKRTTATYCAELASASVSAAEHKSR